ncbi:MAG: M23 family metallopeptidase [Nodosilinea sp. LVE1205-7]|jgi:murein DD-endopeptidase MepM/ murein hydrolase activator NlpD
MINWFLPDSFTGRQPRATQGSSCLGSRLLALLTLLTPLVLTPIAVSQAISAQAQQIALSSRNGSNAGTAALWARASFPVENFQTYTSPFGYRADPDTGAQRFHYGLDMAAPDGSYIRSWWAGEVLRVEDQGACGTSITIKSGEWTHIYCHMHGQVEKDTQGIFLMDREGGIQIRQGQLIPAGARIGRVGMTGRTTGPHLHWGIQYQGSWVDPALVLQAMYVSQQAVVSR